MNGPYGKILQGRRKVTNIGGAHIQLDLKIAENVEWAQLLVSQKVRTGARAPVPPWSYGPENQEIMSCK